jgi:hypothetical protein
MGTVKKNLNAHGGFTPAAPAPQKCDNPGTGNSLSSLSAQGRYWGTGTCPPDLTVLVFHTLIKRYSAEPNF